MEFIFNWHLEEKKLLLKTEYGFEVYELSESLYEVMQKMDPRTTCVVKEQEKIIALYQTEEVNFWVLRENINGFFEQDFENHTQIKNKIVQYFFQKVLEQGNDVFL